MVADIEVASGKQENVEKRSKAGEAEPQRPSAAAQSKRHARLVKKEPEPNGWHSAPNNNVKAEADAKVSSAEHLHGRAAVAVKSEAQTPAKTGAAVTLPARGTRKSRSRS